MMSNFGFAILALVVLALGGLIGWLVGGRGAGALKAERDLHLENFRAAIRDLDGAQIQRDEARQAVARLEAEAGGFELRLAELREAKEALAARGAASGAERVALQVFAHNAGAVALYRGMGFRAHHRYRYRYLPGR